MATSYSSGQTEDAGDPRTGPPPELFAPSREDRRDKSGSQGPVVPAGSVTGSSLILVIAIMCFLACLTAGAVYMINQSADAWLRDVASEVTVQILPREGVDIEQKLDEVASYITSQRGVQSTRTLSLQASTDLLEPWLGQTDALRQLPVPRLIAIQLDRTSPPDFDALSRDLSARFKDVTLDDHRQWQQQIKTVTRSFALGGIAILVLVALATTAIIVSATRSAMASNREIVEVLHFVGATDGFIAREFEKHFLRLGIRAGIFGAGAAMLVFLIMPIVTLFLGGGSMTEVELHRLIGTGALDPAGYVLLGIVVIVIAGLCMLTSRFGVYRILNTHTD
ncbi:MAG: ABC transporter permease [Alphaproteobacteria bacterium]|nr:ABC transporter permease [Alphaproteobacteria bacterium]